MDQNKYTSVLIAYYAGVVTDLPMVSPYARALARAPRISAASEHALMQAYLTDPFLAAKLCGVSNSVFFNFDHHGIYTIHEALERVGFDYARNLLMQAPHLPDDIDETHVSTYWAHCMSVAYTAKKVAASSMPALCHPDVAYLIGMVHDIGYLLRVHYAPELLPQVGRALSSGESTHAADNHPSHGEELVRYWSLPESAVQAVKYHHAPHACAEERGRWLSEVIAVSELLIGATPSAPLHLPETPYFSTATRTLCLADPELTAIQSEATAVYERCLRLAVQDQCNTRLRNTFPLQLVR